MTKIRENDPPRTPFTPPEGEKNQAATSGFYRLPVETIHMIMAYLPVDSFLKARRTCRMMYEVAMTPQPVIDQLCNLSCLPKQQQAMRKDLTQNVKDLNQQLLKTAYFKYCHEQGMYTVKDVSPDRKHYLTAAFTSDNNYLIEVIEVLEDPDALIPGRQSIQFEVRKRYIAADPWLDDVFVSQTFEKTFPDPVPPIVNIMLSRDGGFLALYFPEQKSMGCVVYNLNRPHDEPVQLLFNATIPDEKGIDQVSFSRDNSLLVIAPQDGVAQVFSIINPNSVPLDLPHACPVYCAAFSEDDKLIATGDENGALQVWRIDKDLVHTSTDAKPALVPQQSLTITDEIAITSVAFSADSSLLVAGYADGTVRIWPHLTQAPQPTLLTCASAGMQPDAEAKDVWSVQFSHTG